MSDSDKKKPNRRDFILTATTAAGAVGVGAAVWPLIDQMNPDASVKALASTEVDISSVQPGQSITVLWRGKPVFIKHRTPEEIEEARKVDLKELKHPEKDEDRAKKPEWLVTLGICTHLGCAPKYYPQLGVVDFDSEWQGGFFCPCHGSKFDLAGRVYKGVPAPINLEIPPHKFSGNTLIIGEVA